MAEYHQGGADQDHGDPEGHAEPDQIAQNHHAIANDGFYQQVVSDDGHEMPNHEEPHMYQSHPPVLPHHQQAMAMAQYYEARMRDHAAAYASAAAGAAWAAAQIAVSSHMPPSLPPPIVYPPPHYHHHNGPPPPPYNPYSPIAANNSLASLPSATNNATGDFTPEERPVKRHQRMHPNYYKEQEKRGRRRQRDYSSSSDTGGRSNQHYKSQRRNIYTKKRREKLNLVGKTGVSALHEWCVFRKKLPPNFVLMPSNTNDYFCFAAYVDDLEWSRGRGATKGAAKQDAARKALQALVPGVDFDDNGLVIELSNEDTVEDLPGLAQRLAIDATKKRRCEVYPGTTTTTTDDDGEDENAYYASRGASVCSALLHAMWQINDDIPEPPSYSFEVPKNSIVGEGSNSRPGSFACTATLNLKVKVEECQDESKKDEAIVAEQHQQNQHQHYEANDESDLTSLATHESDELDEHLPSRYTIQCLKGIGTGATKREARHVASAKLLSLLFPDCEGMVEVKAAAEAAREQYAASKALKQQTKRLIGTTKQLRVNCNSGDSGLFHYGHEQYNALLAKAEDPDLPPSVIDLIRSLTEHGMIPSSTRVEEDEVSVESLSLSETAPGQTSATTTSEPELEAQYQMPALRSDTKNEARALSRQQQLEVQVDDALQNLNEFDQVGRSLPHEPNFDDVLGRTVLRRAEHGDARFIYKLLSSKKGRTASTPIATTSLPSSLSSMNELSPIQGIVCPTAGAARRFWGPASIPLLLCRAIALHDEPPLGCAVLTLGFSLKKGRILRVVEIGSGPHLPRERFMECLQQFATHMKCVLDTSSDKKMQQYQQQQLQLLPDEQMVVTDFEVMTTPQLHAIVNSFLKREEDLVVNKKGELGLATAPPSTHAPKLQAVKEEEAEVDEDNKEASNSVVGSTSLGGSGVKDKPSKRSRID